MLHDAILKQAQLDRIAQKQPLQKKCYYCDTKLSDIQASGKIGCARCYDFFADELDPLIELVQNNASSHCGKSPKFIHNEVLINFLEQELILRIKKSIESEDYEEANSLKNKIKELETYKEEKQDIIKFIKRALEFGEYEGIGVGKERINDLYLRLRKNFSRYIP